MKTYKLLNKTTLATIVDKTAYLSTADGEIYKQIPAVWLKGIQDEVAFPSDFEKELENFKLREEEKRQKEAERRKAEAERLRIAAEKEQAVFEAVKAQEHPFIYRVVIAAWEYNAVYGDVSTNPESVDAFYFFDEESAMNKREELLGEEPDFGEVNEVYIWKREFDEIEDCEDYESMTQYFGDGWNTSAVKEVADSEYISFKEADESIEGGLILWWAWNTYVGYAVDVKDIAIASYDMTYSDLVTGNEDRTFRSNGKLLCTKEELNAIMLEDDPVGKIMELMPDKVRQSDKYIRSMIEEAISL